MDNFMKRALGRLSKADKKVLGGTSGVKSSKERRVLMLGADHAGKTTLLYNMKLGEVVTTIPTIGFNVETVTIGRTECAIWDVGGQPKIRALWRHYFPQTELLIWVVSSISSDSELQESGTELSKILGNDDMKAIPIMFVLTRADCPNSQPADQVLSKMQVPGDMYQRENKIVSCCATGDVSEVMNGIGTLLRVPQTPYPKVSATTDASSGEDEAIFRMRDGLCENAATIASSFLAPRPEYAACGVPEAFSPAAVPFGGKELPHEVIFIITSFLDVPDLFPGPLWHFTRGLEGTGAIFAVSKCFLYSALRTLQFRLIDSSASCLFQANFEKANWLQLIFALQVPPAFVTQHYAVLAMSMMSWYDAHNNDLVALLRYPPLCFAKGNPLHIVIHVYHVLQMLSIGAVVIGSMVETTFDLLVGKSNVTGESFLLSLISSLAKSVMESEVACARWLVENIDDLHPMGGLLEKRDDDDDVTADADDIRLGMQSGPVLDSLDISAEMLLPLDHSTSVVKCVQSANFFSLSIEEKERILSPLPLNVWFAALRLMTEPNCPCRRFYFRFRKDLQHLSAEVLSHAIRNASDSVMEVRIELPKIRSELEGVLQDGEELLRSQWDNVQLNSASLVLQRGPKEYR